MFRRLLLASTLLAAQPALANDSTAELGTGGLILSRSDVIAMEREDLFISKDKITVDYVFRNRSDEDVETIVAFPMPDIEANPYGMVSIPQFEEDNFLGFEVTVDGKDAKPELEQKAFALGIDITDLLKQHNVPVNPVAQPVYAALEARSARNGNHLSGNRTGSSEPTVCLPITGAQQVHASCRIISDRR